jgi:putative membrane protein
LEVLAMWGPMMGYGFGGWGWMMALNWVFWIAVVAIVLAALFRLGRSAGAAPPPSRSGIRSGGLDALEERYARGEIQRDEFLQKKADILAAGPAPAKRP